MIVASRSRVQRIDPVVDGRRVGRQQLDAPSPRARRGRSPSRRRPCPSKVTTRATSGMSTRRSRSLATCSSSSAKTTTLPELASDVGHVGRDGRRVDRRRRAARAHHGQVGQGPLVPGGRGDRDAVLGLHARGRSGRRRAGRPARCTCAPGHRPPGLGPAALGEAERLGLAGSWRRGRGTGGRHVWARPSMTAVFTRSSHGRVCAGAGWWLGMTVLGSAVARCAGIVPRCPHRRGRSPRLWPNGRPQARDSRPTCDDRWTLLTSPIASQHANIEDPP